MQGQCKDAGVPSQVDMLALPVGYAQGKLVELCEWMWLQRHEVLNIGSDLEAIQLDMMHAHVECGKKRAELAQLL